MMPKPIQAQPAPRHAQHGFTLLSVLVSLLVLSFGLLAIGKSYVVLVNGVTQNQNISSLAGIGNEFWGVVQATPSVLDALTPQDAVTSFQSANQDDAPAALQPWLTHVFRTMPDATVAIVPAAGCSAAAGCALRLTVSWTPSFGGSRSQVFDYQLL